MNNLTKVITRREEDFVEKYSSFKLCDVIKKTDFVNLHPHTHQIIKKVLEAVVEEEAIWAKDTANIPTTGIGDANDKMAEQVGYRQSSIDTIFYLQETIKEL